MRDFELLCEIEDLQNRVSRLETEKMDIMLENGKNKKKLYAKKDKIKKQNIKLKNLQSQLDQQKAMWNELKEWLNKEADHVRYTPYDCRSLSSDFELWHLNKILDKMQELEGEDVED